MKNESRPHYIWRSMKARCLNKNDKGWKNYGGRGITICEEWAQSFDDFWRDMQYGYSDELQIDRIDNNKGYFKENCQWTTAAQNARNKRTNKRIETNLGKLLAPEISEITSINEETIRWRIYNNWPSDKLLFPSGSYKRRTKRNHLINTPSGTLTLKEAEKKYGISESLLRYRIKKKWSQSQLFQRPR